MKKNSEKITKPEFYFPEFKESWEVIKLNEVLETCISKNKLGKYQKEDMLSVSSSVGVVNQMEYKGRSFAGTSVLPYNILKKGQIVYTKSPLKEYPYGIIKFNDFDSGIVSTLYATYNIKKDYSGEFIDYYFQLPYRVNKYLKPLVNIGAKNDMKVNNDKVLSDPVIFPKYTEQKKIVSFLKTVDKKIKQLTLKVEELELYKEGVNQKIFNQEIRFKDQNNSDFPKWKTKRLGDLTKKSGKKNKEAVPYPIYSINNKEGFLPQGDQFEGMDSNDRGYDISMYKIIKKNTFAYNPARINVGSIGFSGELNDIIISSLYVCFQTTSELEDLYLLKYLDTFDFKRSVLKYVEGGVRQYLFYENFSSIRIPLPCNAEQKKIAELLGTIDSKINKTKMQLEDCKNWKKALLQKMFV